MGGVVVVYYVYVQRHVDLEFSDRSYGKTETEKNNSKLLVVLSLSELSLGGTWNDENCFFKGTHGED